MTQSYTRWTAKRLRILKRSYGRVPSDELAAKLGCTIEALRTAAKKTGIQRQVARKMYWSPEDIERVRQEYPNRPTDDLACDLGRPSSGVYQMAAKLRVTKSAEFLEDVKRSGRFDKFSTAGTAYRYRKGRTPENKGLRRPGWHRGRMRETQFRKGNRPHTWMPIGSFRITKDGYLEKKFSDAPGNNSQRWRGYHRLVWEAANGPVPVGHVVTFKPRCHTTDPAQITLDRIEMISRKELARRNHWSRRLPKPVQELITLRTAIKRKITMRLKHEQSERDRGTAPPSIRHSRRPERQRKAAGRRSRESRV